MVSNKLHTICYLSTINSCGDIALNYDYITLE